MIDGTTLGPREPIYTFIAWDGTNIHIHSSRLRTWCLEHRKDLEIVGVPVDRNLAHRFLTENVASRERVKELMLRNDALDPIIFCKDNTFTEGRPDVMLVDGHHRFVLYAALEIPFIPSFFLDYAAWQPFRIVNIPPIDHEALRAMPITKRSY